MGGVMIDIVVIRFVNFNRRNIVITLRYNTRRGDLSSIPTNPWVHPSPLVVGRGYVTGDARESRPNNAQTDSSVKRRYINLRHAERVPCHLPLTGTDVPRCRSRLARNPATEARNAIGNLTVSLRNRKAMPSYNVAPAYDVVIGVRARARPEKHTARRRRRRLHVVRARRPRENWFCRVPVAPSAVSADAADADAAATVVEKRIKPIGARCMYTRRRRYGTGLLMSSTRVRSVCVWTCPYATIGFG